jgi:hypothetical protein
MGFAEGERERHDTRSGNSRQRGKIDHVRGVLVRVGMGSNKGRDRLSGSGRRIDDSLDVIGDAFRIR